MVPVNKYWLIALLGMLLLSAGCNSEDASSVNEKESLSMPAETGAAQERSKTSSMALPERTNIAWEMSPFYLKDLQGEMHTLEDWKGKVIMMNFWASWCGPCQYEIPEFVQYQDQYGDKGLQLIGIGVDEKRKLQNVARSLNMNYPTLVLEPSAAGNLMRKWGNDAGVIPHTVVIAPDGRIKYIHRGQMEEEAFNTYVLPLLE